MYLALLLAQTVVNFASPTWYALTVATTMASKLLTLTTNLLNKDHSLGAGPRMVFFILKKLSTAYYQDFVSAITGVN